MGVRVTHEEGVVIVVSMRFSEGFIGRQSPVSLLHTMSRVAGIVESAVLGGGGETTGMSGMSLDGVWSKGDGRRACLAADRILEQIRDCAQRDQLGDWSIGVAAGSFLATRRDARIESIVGRPVSQAHHLATSRELPSRSVYADESIVKLFPDLRFKPTPCGDAGVEPLQIRAFEMMTDVRL